MICKFKTRSGYEKNFSPSFCFPVQCVDSPDIRNPCSLNPLREPFAKKECGILLSEAFEACHPVVSCSPVYKQVTSSIAPEKCYSSTWSSLLLMKTKVHLIWSILFLITSIISVGIATCLLFMKCITWHAHFSCIYK